MNSNPKQRQQGDVFFERVAALPTGAKKVKEQDGIFAHGEVTGHMHRATTPSNVELYEVDGIKYARVIEPIEIVHEEHNTIFIDPGIYQYGQVREHDYLNEVDRIVVD
jgi:hypothetical protein